MSVEFSPKDDLYERVSRSIANGNIGSEILFADLIELGGIGDIHITTETLTVLITLPIPSKSIREDLESQIRSAVSDIDEITQVECIWEPCAASSGERIDFLPDVKNIIAVASGKGGVGKSTVSVNLATALADFGASVGLLDADIYGPNAPAMLGLSERTPDTTHDDSIRPRSACGVSIMSMGFIVGEDDPVIWRGPLVDDFLKQLCDDVQWGELDYLIIDLPPGTGDAHLTLVQHLPVTGAVIVTTPQDVAIDDAARGLRGFTRNNVPILGIVENMSYFECPDCETEHTIFDSDGAEQLGKEFGVPVLGQIPTDPAVGTLDTDENSNPPRISIPLIGQVQLPQTREERERSTGIDPIVIREDGGKPRVALEKITARTAARVNHLSTKQTDAETLPDQ